MRARLDCAQHLPAARGRLARLHASDLIEDIKPLVALVDSSPAVDRLLAHAFLPPTVHGLFKSAYGPIDESTWQAARVGALWHTATVLECGGQIADHDLIREGQATLKHLTSG
jgi:hypothetical protein